MIAFQLFHQEEEQTRMNNFMSISKLTLIKVGLVYY